MANYSLPSWTDQELLDLIRESDDYAAFTELYRRYWQPLMTTAGKRVGSLEMAEEVVQDVFIDFYRRRHVITIETTVAAYLNAALRNQVFKVYRSLRIHERYVQHVLDEPRAVPDRPDRLLEAKELREQILQVSGKMPEKCREVFLLSRFEQLSHSDIAERLGISVNTVKRHIGRALEILREEFRGQELGLLITMLSISLL